jgi:hypothetical protein
MPLRQGTLLGALVSVIAASPGLIWLLALALFLLSALVIFPAVWSTDKDRRKAALDVLERITRCRR